MAFMRISLLILTGSASKSLCFSIGAWVHRISPKEFLKKFWNRLVFLSVITLLLVCDCNIIDWAAPAKPYLSQREFWERAKIPAICVSRILRSEFSRTKDREILLLQTNFNKIAILVIVCCTSVQHLFENFTDVTLADDDTNSILADDANRANWSWRSSLRWWWSGRLVWRCPMWAMRSPRGSARWCKSCREYWSCDHVGDNVCWWSIG